MLLLDWLVNQRIETGLFFSSIFQFLLHIYNFSSFIFIFDFREMGGGETGTGELNDHGLMHNMVIDPSHLNVHQVDC